jgi:hypothetical protein
MLSLWSNVCCVTLVLTFGVLSKFMNLTLLLNATNILQLTAFGLSCYDIIYNQDLSWRYDLGYITTVAMQGVSYMFLLTYLANVATPETRGTMFSFNGLVGSTAILVLQGVGGNLYTNLGRQWPFLIVFLGFSIYVLITVFFSLAGKVK